MRQSRRFFILGITSTLLMLGGCSKDQIRAGIAQYQPTAAVNGVRVTGLDFDTVDLAFDVKIDNPNPVGINMAGFTYDFQLQDKSFVQGDQTSSLSLTPQGSSTLEVPMTLNFNDLYAAYSALKGADEAPYALDLGLKFNVAGIPLTLPVSQKGTLPLPKLPSLGVSSMKVNSMGLTSADMELMLTLDNPNNFGMTLDQLNYALDINGQSWAKGVTSSSFNIGSHTKSVISIPMHLDFMKLGSSVVSALSSGQSLNYKFTGDVQAATDNKLLGAFRLPITQTGTISILK